MKELVMLLAGRRAGVVTQDRQGRLTLVYDEGWRAAPDACPLSLCMPLSTAGYAHDAVEAFLWGLLPDSATVQDRWAERFGVPPRDVFALLAHVGEDCAGSVQFARPERLAALLSDGGGNVEWLDGPDVAERLRTLGADHSAWRSPRDAGQFTLAGAQPKTALFREAGRWGVPSGTVPTTHILKPPAAGSDGHAENEHVCLGLARSLGLAAADSEVMRFADTVAVVVRRYDRAQGATGPVRLHQEDMCQALGLPPTMKYEDAGGPGARTVAERIRSVSAQPGEDVARFVDALAFNWLIAGTDAHAKNYALLIGASGSARLAPLYDVASALPCEVPDPQDLRLAMAVGGEARIGDIGPRQWRRLAADLRLDPDALVGRIIALAEAMSGRIARVRNEAEAAGLDHPLVGRLAAALAARARHCARLLRRLPPA